MTLGTVMVESTIAAWPTDTQNKKKQLNKIPGKNFRILFPPSLIIQLLKIRPIVDWQFSCTIYSKLRTLIHLRH
ncbi:MAG: hypothetical protein KQH63_13870 [Desulfobulbaceae bacterium]|nr:hypothetical protein [Desulfobulbaceae bacterium]